MSYLIRNKRILITGGTGSLGTALAERVLMLEPAEIRIFSRSEQNHARMRRQFQGNLSVLTFSYGDVTNRDQVASAMEGIHFVFHFAAMKRVEECEPNPLTAQRINQSGSYNVTDVALKTPSVEHVIGASSDKACNPKNVYGRTKLAMEGIFCAAQSAAVDRPIKFSLVRGGNFLGSNGSVVPTWADYGKNRKPLEITDKKMRRFTLLSSEAVDLYLWTLEHSQGGQIITREMPTYKVKDLAEIMKAAWNVGEKIKGAREKAEKDCEELISGEEQPYTIEMMETAKPPLYLLNRTMNLRIFVLTPGIRAEQSTLVEKRQAKPAGRIYSAGWDNFKLYPEEIVDMIRRAEKEPGEYLPIEYKWVPPTKKATQKR